MAFVLTLAISLGNNGKVLEQIYQRRYEGLLLGFSSLLTLSVVETAIRLIDPFGISYYEEEKRYAREKVADAELHFRHPFSWKTRYQGVEVSFNELGLRDEPIGVRQDNEYRILVLGDSVTFGWGIERDATFCVGLQQKLNEQLERPIRVINAGVGGYNTEQEFLLFKEKELALAPDMVVLVYTAENDTESYRAQSSDPLNTIEGRVLWNSWFYRLASHAYYYGWLRSVRHDVAAVRQSNGWQASIAAIRQLKELTEERKISFVLFYFRWLETSLNAVLLDDIQQAVAPVVVIDIGEWFAGRPLSAYVNSKIDTHPNAHAHKRIAENMATHLLKYPASQKVL
jgi:hypothetical protein